jgi:tripartite-type tricarboxylate transporter receptor subunit TctC
MNHHVRRRALLIGGAALATPALAQSNPWPDRPIELIVPWTAGGGTDVMARTYARFLERRIGGTIVVQNRPGAGSEVGLAAVARSRPDGHTLAAVTMPAWVTIPIERNAQYRGEDFAPVALIATDPSAMTVHAASDYRSVQDVIEAARREPGRLTFGSGGIGSDDHLQLVMFQYATGTQLTHVSFGGTPQVRTALLGRQLDIAGLNVGEIAAVPQNMRMLVQAGDRRSRFMPDVPTYKELGLAVDMSSERGIAAPAATPAPILARLREASADVARDPEFIGAMEAQFTEMRVLIGEAWSEELKARRATYQELWRRAPWAERS